MKDWIWGLLLFVLLVVVLINPFKRNLREYHVGRGGYGHANRCGECGGGCGGECGGGCRGGCGGGCGGASVLHPYDEDYVLPRYFPFPLGYY
jgi:hypothetical protein